MRRGRQTPTFERVGIGIELDDGYFEIARKRIEDAQRERESKLF